MKNREFAAAVINMMEDPSTYSRCPVKDLILIDAVLGVIREGIEKELASRKRQPRLRLVHK